MIATVASDELRLAPTFRFRQKVAAVRRLFL
jgi:hypothetical protein